MAFQPHWSRHDTGWYDIHPRHKCVTCHEEMGKKHGLNKTDERRQLPTARALFLFGVGPYCFWCGYAAWRDGDFFKRSGSNDYSSKRFDLDAAFRPNFGPIQDEMKKL